MNARQSPSDHLQARVFKLFCSDHVDHFYSDLYATKRVDFYHHHLDDANISCLDKQKPGSEAGMLYSDVYLDGSANCSFGPFPSPEHASRKPFKAKSCDGEHELSFKFIGNGYLELMFPREITFMNPYGATIRPPPLLAAPKMVRVCRHLA